MSNAPAPVEALPAFPTITIDGAALSQKAQSAIVEARVVDNFGVPAHARVMFRVDASGLGLSAEQLDIGMGKKIKIEVYNGIDTWTIFQGLVVSLGIELDTGTSQHVVVEAYDSLYRLSRETLPRSYTDMSAADVVGELARQCGLQADVTGLNAAIHKFTYQYATAYAFIDRVVREAGCEWYVEDTTLHVRPRTSATASTLTLEVGHNLISFNARFSASEHVKEVTVTGWDLLSKQRIVGTATSTGAQAKSVIGLTHGSVASSDVHGIKALTIPRPVDSQSDAEAIAKGIVTRREGEMLRARGEAIPVPALKPGVQLVVGGLGATWNGTYYCTGVEHVIGSDPLRTYFTVGPSEPDSLVDIFGDGGAQSLERMLGSMTIGIVTNNKDPDSLNRVKVKLPYLSDELETGWARVLQPGSGNNRGWNVLPEVNDEVLVGFEHGNLDRPLVLGGLINGKDKPKYAHVDVLKDGKVESRVFNSRLGHELRFSDIDSDPEKQFVQLKTSQAEATVFIGAKKVEVAAPNLPITLKNAKGSIDIDADGNITLKGEKIVIDAKQDVEIKAMNVKSKSNASTKIESTATLDLKGSGPTTLESSAITTVKGSLVQIN